VVGALSGDAVPVATPTLVVAPPVDVVATDLLELVVATEDDDTAPLCIPLPTSTGFAIGRDRLEFLIDDCFLRAPTLIHDVFETVVLEFSCAPMSNNFFNCFCDALRAFDSLIR